MVDQREGLASDDLRYFNGGSRGTEYWWADYTCRIQNEISNHLQNLYKNFRFMAFWRSYHTYTSMHGPRDSCRSSSCRYRDPSCAGWWMVAASTSSQRTRQQRTTSHFSFLFSPSSTFAFSVLVADPGQSRAILAEWVAQVESPGIVGKAR